MAVKGHMPQFGISRSLDPAPREARSTSVFAELCVTQIDKTRSCFDAGPKVLAILRRFVQNE
jgi:hypothetical protein